MKIVLYSTDCPNCKFLEAKMIEKDIPFEEVNDVDEMKKFGITRYPMLKVGDKLMDFSRAIEWVRKM